MRAISRGLTTDWLVRTSVDIENVSPNRSQRAFWIKHIPKFLEQQVQGVGARHLLCRQDGGAPRGAPRLWRLLQQVGRQNICRPFPESYVAIEFLKRGFRLKDGGEGNTSLVWDLVPNRVLIRLRERAGPHADVMECGGSIDDVTPPAKKPRTK
jgi:hypothetical protein